MKKRLTRIGLMAALLAVTGWMAVPTPIPFTLQLLSVFCALGLLGGRDGTVAVAVYLVMGAIGLPVFSSFRSGLTALFGATGGFLMGFIPMGLCYWLCDRFLGRRKWGMAASMVISLAVLYLCGTAWYAAMYAKQTGLAAWSAAFSLCVLPFIPVDLLKILLAAILSLRLRKRLGLTEN